MKLLCSNLKTFRAGIPWNHLPKTFQDAVLTTRNLGFRYLWIDALCIIQDSKDDWAAEAATMANIYANSALNISATDSHNGDGGLFRRRNDQSRDPFYIKACEIEDSGCGRYACYVDTWDRHVDNAAVNARAWVVQERYLAPRVVHFGRDQVYWECQCLTACEFLPDNFDLEVNAGPSFKKLYPDLSISLRQAQGARDVYGLWYRLASTYARCGLTIASDRPVAIAGLARTFASLLGLTAADYVCGLWRPKFIHELTWTCNTGFWVRDHVLSESSAAHLVGGQRMPSWSWLSIYRNVMLSESAATNVDHPVQSQLIAELREVITQPLRDPFGPVSSARVKLRAPLCRAMLSHTQNPFHRRAGENHLNHTIGIENEVFRQGETFYLGLDDASGQFFDCPVYLMLCETLPFDYDPFEEWRKEWDSVIESVEMASSVKAQ